MVGLIFVFFLYFGRVLEMKPCPILCRFMMKESCILNLLIVLCNALNVANIHVELFYFAKHADRQVYEQCMIQSIH